MRHRGRAAATRPADPATTAGRDVVDAGSLADVTERLFAAFETQLALPLIVRVVRRCRRELDIRSGPATLTSVERLARQRLHGLVSGDTRAEPAKTSL